MYRLKQLVFIALLFSNITFSQRSADNLTTVDSLSILVKYKNDLKTLTKELTSSYTEQLLKVRAIFKWITDNIQYDYKYYNKYYYKGKEPAAYKCKNKKACEAKRIAWELKYVDKILRKKKAVCQGYSMLFKKMCEIAGLESEVIPGYIRTDYYQVGTLGKLDHAWNAIWIDSAYYLLDATWAAGTCGKDDDGKLLFFKKSFNNYYWLTPPSDFIRNHYPQNIKWTLLSDYSKDSFATNPYYLPSEIHNLELITPASGVITAEKGDTIQFVIRYNGYFNDLQINSNLFRNPDIWVVDDLSKRKKVRRLDTLAIKKQQYIKYKRDGDLYKFQYFISDHSLYYIDVLFDRQRVMRFKVNVKKES